MTENSYPWPDNATGDGTTYTDDQWSDLWNAAWALDRATMAPIVGRQNELVVAGTTSPLSVDTGEAFVDGKYYTNTASVSVTVPTPSGGNSRIDLIVLQKGWTAQTVRIVRIAGTEAPSPSRPSLTQTDGVTWEVEIAEATITDAGVITVVDKRVFSYAATSLLHELQAKSSPVSGDLLIFDSTLTRKVRFYNNRFAWALSFGQEGGGVIPDLQRVGPMRIPQGITTVTLDRVTMMATVSGSIIFKIMSAAFSTSGIPATEVSASGDRPSISSAFAAEKTSFTSWDLVWNSGDELFVEVVGAATTIEQCIVQLEGTIQP